MWDPTGSQRTTRGKRLQFNSYLVPNPKLRAARVHVHNTYVRGLWGVGVIRFVFPCSSTLSIRFRQRKSYDEASE